VRIVPGLASCSLVGLRTSCNSPSSPLRTASSSANAKAAAKPYGEPRGYQGTEAEDEQIADALDAISAEWMTVPSVATALRAYFGADAAGAGERQLTNWYFQSQPDDEPLPQHYGLSGLTFPTSDLEESWRSALSDPGHDANSAAARTAAAQRTGKSAMS
jgi:hypothetical protein